MTILNHPLATTLSTRTVRMPSPESLLDLLPDAAPVAWVRAGQGLVGWGEAARVELPGPDPAGDAARWWGSVVASADVDDDVAVPGSGPVCFASFAFDPAAAASVLVVPEVVVGHHDGTWFVTTVVGGAPGRRHVPESDAGVGPVRYDESGTGRDDFRGLVDDVVARIRRGEVAKVVLARDVLAHLERPLDVRGPLRRLAARYGDCWTFCVDGLFGATPELLVRLRGGVVTSRVLAGTVSSAGGPPGAASAALLASAKEREEHAYAVASVRDALAPHCTAMDVPDEPFVLPLPNVAHLATDVSGVTGPDVTVLGLLSHLHPTAAVCGTPRAGAREVLAEVEGLDRGRYAGPVGWFDARGEGEFGLALRCAQIDPEDARRVRLFAGCGIVAESDPDAELAESEAKLRPVREALET